MKEKAPSHQILYLNGPSSCGKSELAKALQEKLDPLFLHISLDKVIGMMPEKFNNWEGGPAPLGFSWKKVKDDDGTVIQEIQAGPIAKKVVQAHKEMVLSLAKKGYNLIIDDVSLGKEQVDQWRALLIDFNMLYIGVKAPLHIIEEREKKRANRIIGSARAQAKSVHVNVDYDLEIDTYQNSLRENVETIIMNV